MHDVKDSMPDEIEIDLEASDQALNKLREESGWTPDNQPDYVPPSEAGDEPDEDEDTSD